MVPLYIVGWKKPISQPMSKKGLLCFTFEIAILLIIFTETFLNNEIRIFIPFLGETVHQITKNKIIHAKQTQSDSISQSDE